MVEGIVRKRIIEYYVDYLYRNVLENDSRVGGLECHGGELDIHVNCSKRCGYRGGSATGLGFTLGHGFYLHKKQSC